MNRSTAFRDWATRDGYNPNSRANRNAPAGIYQGRTSHFFVAGEAFGIRPGKWWAA